MLTFEWDEAKAVTNRAKHGISFSIARRVFSDPCHIETLDHGETTEHRFLTIGMVHGKELCVVYTTRSETIRIISAREATRYEIFRYWQNRQKRALPR